MPMRTSELEVHPPRIVESLGGHVSKRPDRGAGAGQLRSLGGVGQAEIDQAGEVIGAQ